MSVNDVRPAESGEMTPESVPPTSGINDYELRQIVEVATSYLETGLFDDADDILQEVLEAGAVSPEIEDLIRRIEEARASSGAPRPVAAQDGAPAAQRPAPLVYLTTPLPGAERLPRSVQRLIAETERDFHEGRRQSALDLCHVVTAQAPDYIPNYLRTAQVRIALGDVEGARAIIATVERFYEIEGIQDDPMLESLYVALNPDDTDALVRYARYLLAQPGPVAVEPFVPAAIDATLDVEPDTARELARALLERRPNDDGVMRTYLRAAIATSDADEVHDALARHVREDMTAVDLLWWRAASAATRNEPDWPRWLERVAQQVRLKPENYGAARAAIEHSAAYAPAHVRFLGGAILSLAAGQWDAAQAELDDWQIVAGRDVDGVAAVLAACARVEAIEYLGLPDIVPALDNLLAATVRLADPTQLPEELFTVPLQLDGQLERYRVAVSAHDMIEHGMSFLRELLSHYPDAQPARRAYAEMLLEAGRRNDGIRELRALAQSYERAGNLPAMVDAMRAISQAVADNVEIKQMLIDVYLRRGILDEALRELELVAALKHDNMDIDGAIAAYTRAAEIACAMGNFALGNELYDRGVSADPDNVPVRHAAVAFYLQTGAVDRAVEHLREIVRIALAEQDPDEAVAALHQIIGLAPDDPASYHKLGEVLTAMGEYKQAERVYRRLSDLAPNDPVLQAKQSALAVLAATG